MTFTTNTFSTTSTSAPGKCCEKTAALIPLVMAALSDPASNADMQFLRPLGGPTGG